MAKKVAVAKKTPKKKVVSKTVKKTVAKIVEKKVVKKGAASRKITISEAELQSRIEARAYQIYLERGCSHGNDAGDWYRAEKDLRSRIKSN